MYLTFSMLRSATATERERERVKERERKLSQRAFLINWTLGIRCNARERESALKSASCAWLIMLGDSGLGSESPPTSTTVVLPIACEAVVKKTSARIFVLNTINY